MASSTSSVTGSGNDLPFEVRLTRVVGLLQLQALYAQPGSLGLSVLLRVAPTVPPRVRFKIRPYPAVWGTKEGGYSEL
jgi:hypothetical protein